MDYNETPTESTTMTFAAIMFAAAGATSAVKSYRQVEQALDALEHRVNNQVRLATMREEIALAEASGIPAPFHPSAVGANHFAMQMQKALA